MHDLVRIEAEYKCVRCLTLKREELVSLYFCCNKLVNLFSTAMPNQKLFDADLQCTKTVLSDDLQ